MNAAEAMMTNGATLHVKYIFLLTPGSVSHPVYIFLVYFFSFIPLLPKSQSTFTALQTTLTSVMFSIKVEEPICRLPAIIDKTKVTA